MIIAGLMAGTSADALDVALVEFTPGASDHLASGVPAELTMRLLAAQEVPFPGPLGRDILRLLEPGDIPLSLVSRVDAQLGQISAEAVEQVSHECGLSCDLVVSHGQTVRHDVHAGAVTSTLQLGQPAWIAERLGVPVLSDIRARDVAAGGQGAPLTGIMDQLLLADTTTSTAMLNLGGIANITVVAPGRPALAFDTGPANALIDIMARRITGDAHAIDRDGALAASGQVAPALFDHLLGERFYTLDPPKSTGKELFNARYLDAVLTSHPNLDPLDVIATVTALTARTVADACTAHGVTGVVASGGGTRNPTLMAMLGSELGPQTGVQTSDEAFGLPESAKEACLMALLGWLSWHGLPGALPGLTGARPATVAGHLTPGSGPLQLPSPRSRPPQRLRLVQ